MHSTAVASDTGRASSTLEHFLEVRETSLRLCAPLSIEDHALQPMPDASPAKWHLAHTTWFFETFVLSQYADQFRSYHPVFRNLFNSYYNTVGDRPLRALRHVLSRPSLDEVHAYRAFVDDAMAQLLTRELPNAALALINLGINHEQQHQELIVTDVKNGLWTNPLRPAYREELYRTVKGRAGATAQKLKWHGFAEGVYPIGFAGDGFTFDNETPQHKVYLDAFRLASRLITNGEYLDFMRDAGYATPTLWLSDGWDCVRNNQWTAPLYWEQRDGEWWVYTIAGMQPLELNEPVCHVSFYEADAFAHWAGARLATEFEWEVAANAVKVEGNLLESGALYPEAAPGGDGLTQLYGDVWEWTASAYTPYPGFKTAPGAVGEYNGKFMCNQMVLRGGSCATARSHIRSSYRNFFPPHVRWQFMGIRLANGN